MGDKKGMDVRKGALLIRNEMCGKLRRKKEKIQI